MVEKRKYVKFIPSYINYYNLKIIKSHCNNNKGGGVESMGERGEKTITTGSRIQKKIVCKIRKREWCYIGQ